MAIEITQIFVRSSIDIPWFHETWDDSHMEYIQTNYKDTGKYQGKREILDDGLFLVITHIFTGEQYLNEFTNDEYLSEMKNKRDLYNETNNIIRLS
jgi:hypothetical protein